jgi:hypothetical protein
MFYAIGTAKEWAANEDHDSGVQDEYYFNQMFSMCCSFLGNRGKTTINSDPAD